jgi:hypothetical protein
MLDLQWNKAIARLVVAYLVVEQERIGLIVEHIGVKAVCRETCEVVERSSSGEQILCRRLRRRVQLAGLHSGPSLILSQADQANGRAQSAAGASSVATHSWCTKADLASSGTIGTPDMTGVDVSLRARRMPGAYSAQCSPTSHQGQSIMCVNCKFVCTLKVS